MKIAFDADACTSIGMCESLAPDVFELGDDGYLVIHEELVDEARRDELVAACDSCPNSALAVED